MRLWSLQPSLLDPKGLVALWREALLAQKVLRGRAAGYRSHPAFSQWLARCDEGSLLPDRPPLNETGFTRRR